MNAYLVGLLNNICNDCGSNFKHPTYFLATRLLNKNKVCINKLNSTNIVINNIYLYF